MRPAAFFEPRGPSDRGQEFDPPSYSSTTFTRRLLWANGIVFFAMFLLRRFAPSVGDPMWNALCLNAAQWWHEGIPAIWQVVTYAFLHDLGSPLHILFNLLALHFFGTMLEARVGARRFAVQYIVAVAFGGALHLALAPAFRYSSVVGASGGVLYAVIACATLEPRAQVIFFFVPMELRVMALILVALDVLSLLGGGSGTASDVHLAGAALGFVAAKRGWVYFDPLAWWRRRGEERQAEAAAQDELDLDRLLERIHREGIHSLSKREKDFLARMSKRR